MAITRFSWDDSNNQIALLGLQGDGLKLSDDVLVSNIRWFIIFRWALILALVVFQILVLLASDTLIELGIIEQQNWPIAITAVLSLTNVACIYALDYCPRSQYNSPSINLWVQIIVDLICLSVVVHYIGSTTTPVSFFYVLHIALACIFFSTRESLYVTILVCVMDSMVLFIENFTLIPVPPSILVDTLSAENARVNSVLLWMISLDMLFFIVWYVVSRLSLVVRAHEHHLMDAHRQINQAQVEKDQYALLITHQLKSPLDAIRSQINLIRGGYLGESSEEIKDSLGKIDGRAQSMSSLILDLLRLERLKTTCLNTAGVESINLEKTLQKCIDKLTPVANSRQVSLNVSINNFIYQGIPDQLEILLENIISNAITYSHDGSSIEIASELDRFNHSASITIADHGIGIESKDLPNIFNEYFYSPRAARHNKASSGIGLSIVKIAARNNKLRINVNSEPSVGTTFTIIFPQVQFPSDEAAIAV